jgi:hypothetical protein
MAFHALSPVDDDAPGGERAGTIYQDDEHNHMHGIGYDAERDRLFLATHYGLFVLGAATGDALELQRVGDSRDDFMGFSIDPNNGDRLFASGHPRTGGNLGVIRSTDGGVSWEQVWSGPQGAPAVDFHGMAVSPAAPDSLVGFAINLGMLLVSDDGGVSWDPVDGVSFGGACWSAPCLAWDHAEPDAFYVANLTGLYRATDNATQWSKLAEGVHAGVYSHPGDGTLWTWTQEDGMRFSRDQGESWEPVESPSEQAVFAFSGDPGDGDVLFAAFMDSAVYRSLDGGASWSRVHPGIDD